MADETLVARISADLTSFQASMRQMLSEVQRTSQQSQQHFSQLDRSIKTLTSTTQTFNKALSAVGLTISVMGLARLAGDTIDASTKMTALENAFKAITGGALAAKAELTFLREEANRLGLDFVSTAEQFKGLSAAAKGTTLEGQATRDIFTAMAEASRTLGLSTEQTSGALNAISQMISKGTVASEELRGQLGERLPGAFQIAARAMGVTTAELGKMLEQGQVLTATFLPKFTAELRKVGSGASEASQTFQAATARIGNAVNDVSVAFGDLLTKNPQVIKGLNDIAAAIASLAATIRNSPGIAAFFEGVISQAALAIQGVNQVLRAVNRPEALKLLDIQTKAIGEQEQALAALQKTAERLRTQAPLSGLSDFSAGMADELQEVERQIDQAIKKLMDLQKGRAQLQTQFIHATRLPDPMDETMLGAGTQGAGAAGLVAKNLDQLKGLTEEYTKVKAKIAEIQNLLAQQKAGMLPMSPEQLKILNTELESAQKKLQNMVEPANKAGQAIEKLATAGDLKRQIDQLTAWIATHKGSTEAMALAQGQLEKLQDKYNELTTSQLPNAVKEYRLFSTELERAEQRLALVRDSLNPEELRLAEAAVAKLRLEFTALREGMPQEVLAFKGLEQAKQQLEAYLATQRTGSVEAQLTTEALRGVGEQLAQLSTTHLPAAVQAYEAQSRALELARTKLEAVKGTLSPEAYALARAEVDKLAEAFRQLHDAGAPPDVQAFRALPAEIARLEAQMKDIWDPAELQLYQRHLAALKEAHAQLGATIDTELLTKALVPFQKEMQALGITMAEVTARPREMIEALVDLQKAATDTPEALLVAWQRYKALLEAVGATTTEVGQKQIAVQKDVVTAQQAQLKKAQADFERFQEQVRDKVADVMFDFVSNIGDGATSFKDIWHDALESVKDMFLRTLTEMAARALVEKILIPVGVTTSTGAGGTGGSIDLGALLGLFGGKSTGTTAAPGAAVTPTTAAGAPVAATGTLGTAGGVGAGVGTGITVGMVSNDLLQQAGVGSLTSQALAGALGGAVAGALIGNIVPIIGPVVGAIAGAVIGAAIPLVQSWLGNVPKPPELFTAIRTTAPGGTGFVPGSTQVGPFGVVGPTARLDEEVASFGDMFLKLDQAIAEHLSRRQKELAAATLQAQGEGMVIDFREFDNEIFDLAKDRMSTILRGLTADAGIKGHRLTPFATQVFAGIRRDDKNLEQLEAAFAKAAQFLEAFSALAHPEKPLSQAEQALKSLTDQFADFADQARQYGVELKVIDQAMVRQVKTFWETVADNLKTQQENILRAIGGTRQVLEEALMTPAVIFARRQAELEALQGEFAGAGPGKQVAMVPDLLARIQQLLQLGASTDVLGQDEKGLRRLQQDLLDFLDEIEQGAGQDAFNQQIAKAEEQVALLGDIKRITDKHMTDMSRSLRQIERFLTKGQEPFLVGEFQSGGFVPQTGLARVHAGEYVMPAQSVMSVRQAPAPSTSSSITVHMPVTVHASGLDQRSLAQTGTVIGEMAWRFIEDRASRRMIPLKLEKR